MRRTRNVKVLATLGPASGSPEMIRQLFEAGADASLAQIRAIFDERIDAMCNSGENRGCMLCHTAMELAPHDPEIKGVLQRFLKRMSKAFAIGLETAKENGEVKHDLDTQAAGEFLTGAIFGLAVLARSGFPLTTLDSFVDNTISSLTD